MFTPTQRQSAAPRRFANSLVVRALVVFAAVTLAPLAVSLIQAAADMAAAEDRAYAEARGAATVATNQVQGLVENASVTAAAAAATTEFWAGDDEARDAILAALAGPQPEFNALAFFTDDLQQHGASTHQPGAARGTVAERTYAREVVATGRLAVTDEAVLSAATNAPVLPVAFPVRAAPRATGGAPGAARSGFVVVTLRLERLPAVWAGLALPAGSTVTLVDARTGRILAGSGPAAARVNLPLAAADLARIRNGGTAFRTAATDTVPAAAGSAAGSAGAGGAARLRSWGAVSAVPDIPWGVVVDVPADAVFGPIYAAAAGRVATALVLAGAVLGALLLLWRRFAGTLQRLEAATVRWAAGDWAHRAGVGGRDELGTLGAASDQMAARLGAADAAVQAERDALEARVRSRTAELAAQTEQLVARGAEVERANGALRTSERRFRALIEKSADAVLLLAADSTVRYASPSVGTVLGHPPEAWRGRPPYRLCDPDDLAAVQAADAALLDRPGAAVTRRCRMRHADGTWRWVESTTTNRLDDPGVGALVVNFRDVTARAQAEAVATQLAAIVRSSNDAIVGKTLDGLITSWNPSAERLYGYRAAEVIGRPIALLVPPERADELPTILARIRRGERIEHYETVRRRKDGRLIDVSVTVSPVVDGAGRVVGASSITRDVAERKRAEAAVQAINRRLRQALADVEAAQQRVGLLAAASAVLAGSLDEQATLQQAARLAVPQLADWCTIDVLDGADAVRRVAAAHADPTKEPVLHEILRRYPIRPDEPRGVAIVLRTGAPHLEPQLTDADLRTVARDAEHLRLLRQLGPRSSLIVPLVARGRRLGALSLTLGDSARRYTATDLALAADIAGRVATALDNAHLYGEARAAEERLRAVNATLAHQVTEREQAEATVQRINGRLREALDALATTQEQVVQQERLRALGEMASGIAHDFNNSLSPVVGFSELLLATPELLADPATARRYLGLIRTGGLDAAATVRRLSEFSRPRAASVGVVPVDAHRLVDDVIALTQPRWKDQAQGAGRPVRVTAELAPVPPLAGRPEELREALTNLVFNAVGALPAVGGTVTLRVQPVPAGAGAPPSRIVLEVADDGVGMPTEVRQRCLEPFFTTKGPQGSGLGLAMVYGTVRRLRGELEIDSAPGRGTTVRLVLPVYTRPATAPRAAEAPAAEAPAAVARLRVLVVDDEPLVREATAAYLTADGHRVRTAAGGHEAVQALGREPFDLVVTDRAMPDLAGDAVARTAGALGTPVILLTGFGDLMAATDERVAGVGRILAKPVSAAALREAVAAVAGAAEHRSCGPRVSAGPH